MANATDAKKAYIEAKKTAKGCQKNIKQLQKKVDDLEGSLPGLNREIEAAERGRVSALDTFALNSNKTTEQALKGARQAHEDAQKACAEGIEFSAATHRALTKQQAELTRFNNAAELAKRAFWQAIADEIKTAIPSEVFESVKQLQVIGSQTGQTRQWILDSLFPNPSSGEHQEITSDLCEKYNIE